MPKTYKDKIDWLQLTRSRRVGPATFVRLMNEYGSALDALNGLPDIASKAGVKSYAPHNRSQTERELDQGLSLGFTPLFLGTPEYPKLLEQTPDAPAFMWAFGDLALMNRPCVSMVGARNSSSLGGRMARNLAGDLGELGYTIVSGLARGIDATAHSAALPTGTIAVQAGGIDVTYPRENEELQTIIGEQGLRISEQLLGLSPQARHFPQRNRIIAGLSLGVVVVEAASRSGSMITARAAADLGRDVLAVPGSPLDPRAAGCNMLIRDGSILIRSANDIHEALELPMKDFLNPPKATSKPDTQNVNDMDVSSRILATLSQSAVPEDIISRDMGLPIQTLSKHLTILEIEGKITRQSGGLLSLAG